MDRGSRYSILVCPHYFLPPHRYTEWHHLEAAGRLHRQVSIPTLPHPFLHANILYHTARSSPPMPTRRTC